MIEYTPEILDALARSTADAVAQALEKRLPEQIEVGDIEVIETGAQPMDGISVPIVVAEAAFANADDGAALFVATAGAVRKIAAAVMGETPNEGAQPLDERERAAFAKAMGETLGAAADAASEMIGGQLQTAPPAVLDVETVGDALALGEGAQHTVRIGLTVAGETCRVVQLLPGEISEPAPPGEPTGAVFGPAAAAATAGFDEILRGVKLRVCAEIGRATMPVADAVALPSGGLVELDRGAEEPVDVLVNGRLFATGRLVLVEDEWAVRIEEVLGDAGILPETATTSIERG